MSADQLDMVIDQQNAMAARIVNQTANEYHSNIRRVSRSMLVDFIQSPNLYYRRYVQRDPAWQQASSSAMELGTLVHAAVLEGKRLEDLVHVIPDSVLNADGHRKGKEWLSWKSIHDDKPQFKESDLAVPREMLKSVKASPAAMAVLGEAGHPRTRKTGPVEVGIEWEVNGIERRTRLDRINTTCIVDVKTARSCDLQKINNSLEADGYYIQAADYSMAFEALTGETLPFKFLFIENCVPYRTAVVVIDPKWVDEGKAEVLSALDRLQICAESGDWRDPIGDAEIPMSRPQWSKYRWQLTEGDEE